MTRRIVGRSKENRLLDKNNLVSLPFSRLESGMSVVVNKNKVLLGDSAPCSLKLSNPGLA